MSGHVKVGGGGSGAGGGSSDQAVVFDSDVTDNPLRALNIRGNVPFNQSPIDSAKQGIVNLGFEFAAGAGVTEDFCTNVGGYGNTIAASFSTCVGGGFSTISATGATGTIVGGASHTLNGESSVIIGGYSNVTNGYGSVCMGSSSQADGDYACALGFEVTAAGDASIATGNQANALRAGQSAHASGGDAGGSHQTSVIVLRGTAPGVSGTESVNLQYGIVGALSNFNLEDGKAYTLKASLIASGTVTAGGALVARSFERRACAMRSGATVTVTGKNTQTDWGSASLNGSVLDFTASSLDVLVSFTTGATAVGCQIAGRLEFTEVDFT